MWALHLLACSGRDPAGFPAVLAPLDDNRAPWPAPAGDVAYPETLEIVSGGDAELWWAHARGYVHADAEDVWAAARIPEVVVDRREVDEWTVDHDTVRGFDDSFTLHDVVHDILTVEFDLAWVHELQAGTASAPELVVAQWQKNDGTTFIDLLQGSLVIEPVEPGVASVEIIEELKAALRDDETIATYLGDLHASIVAEVHGRPLPTY